MWLVQGHTRATADSQVPEFLLLILKLQWHEESPLNTTFFQFPTYNCSLRDGRSPSRNLTNFSQRFSIRASCLSGSRIRRRDTTLFMTLSTSACVRINTTATSQHSMSQVRASHVPRPLNVDTLRILSGYCRTALEAFFLQWYALYQKYSIHKLKINQLCCIANIHKMTCTFFWREGNYSLRCGFQSVKQKTDLHV